MTTLSPTFECLPQAFITNTSFTAMQAMGSTPFAFTPSAFWTKPGRCLAEHVGVNAPGTENSTTFLPLNRSSVETGSGPFAPLRTNWPFVILSPTLMVIVLLLLRSGDECARHLRAESAHVL